MMNYQVMPMNNAQIQELFEIDKNRVLEIADDSVFGENLWSYYQFVSWARWFPDLYI